MMTAAATVKSLDHLVLTVKSVPKTTEWYEKNLGMRSESFVSAATPDITRYSLVFGELKINLHELGKVYFSSYPLHPSNVLTLLMANIEPGI
jgi:catechol 2,3-dioxygenase-like lactoylglutathione lyase family enzyme